MKLTSVQAFTHVHGVFFLFYFFIYYLSMLHYPGVILHAVGIQITFTFLQGMQWPASPDVSSHCIPFTILYNARNVLFTVIVRRVYEYSLLQLAKIYGFCESINFGELLKGIFIIQYSCTRTCACVCFLMLDTK
jgi:hypothetical protein